EVATVVEVAEVAAPVPAVARAPGIGLVVVVIALERPCTRGVHDLADALLCIEERSIAIEARGRALVAVVVDDLHRSARDAERARRRVVRAVHRDAPLGRAEGVDHLDAEAPREPVD